MVLNYGGCLSTFQEVFVFSVSSELILNDTGRLSLLLCHNILGTEGQSSKVKTAITAGDWFRIISRRGFWDCSQGAEAILNEFDSRRDKMSKHNRYAPQKQATGRKVLLYSQAPWVAAEVQGNYEG